MMTSAVSFCSGRRGVSLVSNSLPGPGLSRARAAGLHGVADPDARLLQELRHVHPRFQDDIDRPCLQHLHQRRRPLLGQRRAHHDGQRMLRHELAQERDAIHSRHLDIDRDDVRHLLLDTPRRAERIGSGTDNLDVRVATEDLRHRLADGGGIIDDQNSDFLFHDSP
jgi:hypothetical protein